MRQQLVGDLRVAEPGVEQLAEHAAVLLAAEHHGLQRRGKILLAVHTDQGGRLLRECDARVIVRGVRSLSDMDTEFTMTLANRKLDPGIETVFLMADEEFSHVSSSLIKQITPLAGDEELARFVPQEIIPDIRAKLERGDIVVP